MLTEQELRTAGEACRIAEETYRKDAATCRGAGDQRTAEHFDELAARAIRLAEKLEI